MDLIELVKSQIELIESGRPLEAFNKFFSDNVILFHNEVAFANNKKDGYELQKTFFTNISNFKAVVYYSNIDEDISTLGIEYSFNNYDNESISFKGIHKQKWGNGVVIKEEFYNGDYLDRSKFRTIGKFLNKK